MIMHHLPMPQRLIGFLFPLLILGMAAVSAPTFIANDLAWWPVFIFALPLLISLVISIEYWNIALGFDESGIQYRSVGYAIAAPWEQVSVLEANGRTSLRLSEAEPRLYPWLGVMYHALTFFMTHRARYARGMMAIVPLSSFGTRPDDAVMADFKRHCPPELHSA